MLICYFMLHYVCNDVDWHCWLSHVQRSCLLRINYYYIYIYTYSILYKSLFCDAMNKEKKQHNYDMWSLFSLLEILISITCLRWCGSLFPFYLSHFFTLTLFRSISVTLWKWVNLTPFLNTRTSTQPLIESSVTKECSPYTVCTVNFYISCFYLTELTCWTNTVKS